MNGQEPEGGNSLKDIQRIARRFEELGIDAVHVSVGFGAPTKTPGFLPSVTPMRASDGCIVHLAENVKKAVSIPVIAVNKIGDIDLAEKILEESRADLIAMGRPLIADPYLPLKGMQGQKDEIVPCIFCCQGCIQNVLEQDEPITCTVNPLAAREGEMQIIPSLQKKKIIVVGGGPGGLIAAKVMQERGHKVILYEKEPELGGQLKVASIPPGKKDILKLSHYLIEKIKRLGVEIHSGEEVDVNLIDELMPEVLVIAAGGRPVVPPIPGIEMDHVVLAKDILLEKAKVGDSVAIIGGGQVGLEVAEYLAENGKKVMVIEILDELAQGMPSIAKLPLLCRLEQLGVTVWKKAMIKEIRAKEVLVQYKGSEKRIGADTVVVAAGSERDRQFCKRMQEMASEIFVVGDSIKPRRILEAIAEGFEIGGKI
jgi:2,4-dienoyl-CoA reductase (NADPH2)